MTVAEVLKEIEERLIMRMIMRDGIHMIFVRLRLIRQSHFVIFKMSDVIFVSLKPELVEDMTVRMC